MSDCKNNCLFCDESIPVRNLDGTWNHVCGKPSEDFHFDEINKIIDISKRMEEDDYDSELD